MTYSNDNAFERRNHPNALNPGAEAMRRRLFISQQAVVEMYSSLEQMLSKDAQEKRQRADAELKMAQLAAAPVVNLEQRPEIRMQDTTTRHKLTQNTIASNNDDKSQSQPSDSGQLDIDQIRADIANAFPVSAASAIPEELKNAEPDTDFAMGY